MVDFLCIYVICLCFSELCFKFCSYYLLKLSLWWSLAELFKLCSVLRKWRPRYQMCVLTSRHHQAYLHLLCSSLFPFLSNFPKLMTNTRSQTQEAQKTSSRIFKTNQKTNLRIGISYPKCRKLKTRKSLEKSQRGK